MGCTPTAELTNAWRLVKSLGLAHCATTASWLSRVGERPGTFICMTLSSHAQPSDVLRRSAKGMQPAAPVRPRKSVTRRTVDSLAPWQRQIVVLVSYQQIKQGQFWRHIGPIGCMPCCDAKTEAFILRAAIYKRLQDVSDQIQKCYISNVPKASQSQITRVAKSQNI